MSSSVFYFIEHGGSYFLLFMLEKRKKRNIQLILLCTFDGKLGSVGNSISASFILWMVQVWSFLTKDSKLNKKKSKYDPWG